MSFEDNFSRQSSVYARYRPHYPDALFKYLASLAPSQKLAWDCATGNGQAATGLARYFEHVIATDASTQQIANAIAHEKIEYRLASAEQSGIDSSWVDLITVATALHWFDLDGFYAEAKRVLKPGGVLAVWGYFHSEIDPAVKPILARYHKEIVGPYWSPRIQRVNDGYRTIPFPFEEIEAPQFYAEAEWDMNDMIGFLHSWSATQAFIEARGYDPVTEIREELSEAWGDPEQRRGVRWPLHLRVGRV